MQAMPRELGKKYDMRRESYVGTLRRDSSSATRSETLKNEESKRTLKSLVGIFYLSAVGIGRKKKRECQIWKILSFDSKTFC